MNRGNEMRPDATYQMLLAALAVAPTEEIRNSFTQMYNNMQRDGALKTTIIRCICNSIIDGIDCNNWPQ